MTPVTIRLAADAPARFRLALASLPRSFGGAKSERPGAVIVGGAAGWTNRARGYLDGGTRAVLVGDPVAEDVHGLRLKAIEAGALIMLAPVGAQDPVLTVMSERIGASDGGLLECRVITSPSAPHSATTMAILDLIRSVDSPLVALDTTSGNRQGFQATGRLESGRDVLLATDVSDAVRPVARLRVISSTGLVEADIPLTDRSPPAQVRSITEPGEWHAEPAVVSPARAVLERFHSAITRSPTLEDLDAFQRDVPFAHRLGWT